MSIEKVSGSGNGGLPLHNESRWNGRSIAIIAGTALGFSAAGALAGFSFFGPMGAVAGAVAGFVVGLFYGIALSQTAGNKNEEQKSDSRPNLSNMQKNEQVNKKEELDSEYLANLPALQKKEQENGDRIEKLNKASSALSWLASLKTMGSDYEAPQFSSDEEDAGCSFSGASQNSSLWSKNELVSYMADLRAKNSADLLPEERSFLDRAKQKGY